MRKKLKKYTDYDLKSFEECIKFLKWSAKRTNDDGKSKLTLKCNCGKSQLNVQDFFGQRMICCANCGKMMLSLLPVTQNGIEDKPSLLKPEKFKVEQDRNGKDKFWIAIRGEE
jgi:hypothetical protein